MKIVRIFAIFIFILLYGRSNANDRYWVHKPFYENFFSTPTELAQWNIVEDNGTGSWLLSGNGTAILKMDNAAGGYANRMFNVSGAAANFLPLDRINGRVEIMVKAITGGNQRIFVQVQQFNSSNVYISEFSVLASQSATGFFTINLSSFAWNAAADKVRFIIGGENFSGQQGTVEFDYFSYSNSNGDWNNTANWSSSSNGAGGASVPGASDIAIFDGASGNNGSCILSSAVTVQGLQMTNGYSGNFDLQGYQFTMGSSGVNIAGGGVTGSGAIIHINGNVTMSGGAYKNVAGYNYVSGDMNFTGGVLDFSTGHVIFDAAGDQQFTSTLTDPIHKLIVNKPSGIINFNSDILISDSLLLTQGILNSNGHIIRLGLSASSIGKLITGNGRINGSLKRWISNSTTGDIDFPLGDASTNALMTVTVNTVATVGGSLIVTYTDASPSYTAVIFPDVLNTTTIVNRSSSNWTIQASGITGGGYSLSASNNHLASFTSLSELHLTLSGSAIASHQAATGTLSAPVLHRSALAMTDLSQTWYASLAVPVKREITVLGSSSAAGTGATSIDSSWVGRLNYYYKYQKGAIDTLYNLAVGATTCYNAMPSSYTPPGTRPSPDPLKNVSKGLELMSDVIIATNGTTIVNFPTNGYDVYSVAEIMASLQMIYDSATRTGNTCFICTSQPRSDGAFASSVIKRKLATIKDSIINRFGEAHSINFWDGMFNPADTTILAAYSAGDNVHLNNAGHKVLFDRVIGKTIFPLSYIAAAGDYRSNVSPTGLWSTAASWQVFDGTSWLAASVPPSNTDGVITIQNGDSIRINSPATFDQVVVENGAILTMFNTVSSTTFTLNDGAGSDIDNSGHLYISANGILTGNGTIQNNTNGLFILRNFGVLQVNTNNDGLMNTSGTGTIQNLTLTNNGVFTLVDFTLNVNNASFINNDSLCFAYNSNSWFASTAGTGFLVNNPGAVIYKSNAAGIATINATVSFANSGSLKGIGQYSIANTLSNTGIITPGTITGSLTLNPTFINSKNPTLQLNLRTNGAVAGVNYDQLIMSTASNTNFTGTTLNVNVFSSDPVGTVYTLVSSPLGTITGPFASVTLSPNLGNLTYNSNSITVQKILSVLPLTWGNFTVAPANGKMILSWNTLQEFNTSHFVIEHSTDGIVFSTIAQMQAAGNSSTSVAYTFTHLNPVSRAYNYYRLKQVDIDGRFSYSVIRAVKNDALYPSLLTGIPNPVKDELNINNNNDDISYSIVDMTGKFISAGEIKQGSVTIDCKRWSKGIYQVFVYKKGKLVESRQLLKL